MTIKRRDFQKAAAFIHEFLLKLQDDSECAELRDSLNLALLHMQKYYRVLQTRNQEKNLAVNLSLTARGLSPMTPFVDAPDKFQYKWINLDSARLKASMTVDESMHITNLPPMIQAAKEGNTDLINDIIHSDPASLDDQDGLGRSALTYAVHFHQMLALQCLLEAEANPNVTAHDGSTAIHQACHDSNSQALSLLLQYGGDFTIPDTQGRAPIHWACTTPSTECLKLLIQHHADVNIRDKDGLSPCMWACRLDHIEHFQYLSQAETFHVDDGDGIERDLIGRTWMHWAVRRMEPLECLQTLLTQDTAAIKDDEGRTVLLTAAELGSLAACKIILDIGGAHCISDRDAQGRNALHLATIGGHGDVVNFLLDQSADLSVVDKFNATPWDYAKNRQLHYCQLIIMSHQRQRLVSNPTSPLPNGLGLMMNGAMGGYFSRGDFENSMDFDYASTRGSVDSMPITPPHPPKRPRTSGMPVRRSRSLGSKDRDRERLSAMFSRGSTISRESSNLSSSTIGDRRVVNSASEMQKKNERIEVSVTTRRTASQDGYMNQGPGRYPQNGHHGYTRQQNRDEIAMATDDNVYEVLEAPDEDLDGVSVGGMDVSDIDDDDHAHPPPTARGPPEPRQPGAPRPGPMARPSQPPHQPAPPRYAPRPPGSQNFSNTMPSYRRSTDYNDDINGPSMDMQVRPPMRSSNPLPGAQRGPVNYYNNRTPSPNLAETFPPSQANRSRPSPAPRPARLQPTPPKPQQRQTPSPPAATGNRPGSGSRDSLLSPPSSDQANRDSRPDSGGNKPPGMLEGKKILPPPMLMPLENAPRPNLNRDGGKPPKKKKKKRRENRGNTDNDLQRELDVRSPPDAPENLTPPRGFAAPLHPPPSATVRPPRAQSGIPSPKYSKGAPQKHEPIRNAEEGMDLSKDETADLDDRPPMVNGMAVPIREGPGRSARPGKRVQPMDTSDEFEMNGDLTNGDGLLQESVINEEDDTMSVIPPPQAFRGPSARPGPGRALSQSIPQGYTPLEEQSGSRLSSTVTAAVAQSAPVVQSPPCHVAVRVSTLPP
ncbi:SH3 and multiple ankyrin repeat domains protein 3-like isoform X2 [Dreissena polymorpha]|uniref:SH3 and multiple ankyrin repeat domains protein 3-like isoform X2 n=1 Tax=Dreissena polymorpha TaxID=45954 RepID=UPI002264DC6C|nr:SH3 and multiple ankyrin repeat domains protein 3-like isoform X2 [Dreissena polymorpha]